MKESQPAELGKRWTGLVVQQWAGRMICLHLFVPVRPSKCEEKNVCGCDPDDKTSAWSAHKKQFARCFESPRGSEATPSGCSGCAKIQGEFLTQYCSLQQV